MNRRSNGALLGALCALVLAACGDDPEALPDPAPDDIAPAPAPPSPVELDEDVPALADELLDYGSYYVDALGGAPVRLRDGEWADEASGRAVSLTPAPRLRGDLDGDGAPEAAAVLVVTAGMGFESYLVAVGAANGRAVQEAIVGLGRMVTVTRMRTEGRALIVETTRIPEPGQGFRPPEDVRFLLEQGAWTRVGG